MRLGMELRSRGNGIDRRDERYRKDRIHRVNEEISKRK